MTQCTILISDETTIGEFFCALLATETLRMPVGCHCLNNAADDEFVTFVAARSEQNMEIVLAILASFELIEDAVLEGPEALSAPKKTTC